MKLTLYRTISGKSGTFGILAHGDIPLCVTLEDPWNNNKTNQSCIPAGTYKCTPHNGTRFKNTWELNKVPGRSAIIIHAGNLTADTQGCILVGEGIGKIRGHSAVLKSQKTMDMLREYIPDQFTLEIKNFTPQVFTNPKLPWWRQLFKGD